MAATNYAIETTDLVKVYPGTVPVTALRGVDLKVRKGEFVTIVGPSGCGKSTLLNLIGVLDPPTSGKVKIDGIDLSVLNDLQLARLRNDKIGFIFQSYNLVARSSVMNNVELPAIVKETPRQERRKRVLELLERVGLAGMEDKKPNQLSGGQQQRAAIARALVNNPTFILGDEPTGSLDHRTGNEILALIRRLNKEHSATIVLVTHNMEIASMSDRIVHLLDGKIEKETVNV